MRSLPAWLGLAALGWLAAPLSAATVWIEGESYVRSNRQYVDWMHGNSRDLLSGGNSAAFLDLTATMPLPLYILWRLEVPETGTYAIHFRSLSLSSDLYGRTRFRFIPVDPTSGSPLARPGAEEGWFNLNSRGVVSERVNAGEVRAWEWSRQGQVYLEKGSYFLDLQTLGSSGGRSDIWGGFDAILLTTDPLYQPRGNRPPG